MSYPLLRRGNKLPAVAVLQKLLNRSGANLVADGIYGSNTKRAVVTFQAERGLSPDGVVGKNSWPRLVSNEWVGLQVIDCIDVLDPSLNRLEANDIRRVGGDPVLIGGMCNGVEQMVTDILARASIGNVFLLRFHGHGASGIAGISDGQGGTPGEFHSSIEANNLAQISPILRRLKPIFGKYGCVQFMHCQTGRGISGHNLLSGISNTLGVPATAAIRNQLGGGLTTFEYEGPTRTLLPGGKTLRSWSQGIPDFVSISVP